MNISILLLQEHCYNLYKRLIAEFEYIELDNDGKVLLDWLRFAFGMNKIEVNTTFFEEECFMCKNVFDYEHATSYVLEECGTEITRFLYIWHSFEALMSFLGVPQKTPEKTITFLRENYDERFPLPDYFRVIQEELIQLYPKDINNKIKDYKKKNGKEFDFGQAGKAFYIVKKKRNHIVHGAFNLPEASLDEDRFDKHYVFEEFSRILLMIMQMMIISSIDGGYSKSIKYFKPEYLNYEILDINIFRVLHIGGVEI
jgi:hypothetical protein